jgi:prevent-host-death family protein
MDSYNLADVKARLSELVAKAESGEPFEITRRGKTVARVLPPERPVQKVDVARLKRLTDSLPWQDKSAAELIREMRDAGY